VSTLTASEFASAFDSNASGVAKGGNWGHAPQGAGPWNALTHFIQPFKNAFEAEVYTKICLKCVFFCIKSCKIAAASRAPTPNPCLPPVAGGSALRQTTQQMLCFYYSRAFAPIFHFKFCSFCWWGRKNIFAPGRMVP